MSIVDKAIDKIKSARGSEASTVAGNPRRGFGHLAHGQGPQSIGSPLEVAEDVVVATADVWRRAGLLSPNDDPAKGLPSVRSVKQDVLRHADTRDEPGAAYTRRVIVTSALPGDGKTFLSANLAMSLAGERDYETLLVDGDVAMQHLTRALDLEGKTGLLDLLRDSSIPYSKAVYRTTIPRLLMVPAGTWAEDAPDLIAGDHLARLMDLFTSGNSRRIVVLDSSPVLVSPDSRVIAQHTGQVLFVVRAAATLQRDVRHALSTLQQEDRRIALVLNQTAPADLLDALVGHRQEGYGYGYGMPGASGRGGAEK